MNGGLGSRISAALERIGITPESVERWIGRPCGCRERAERLDQLGWWAARVLSGRFRPDDARDSLERMTEEKGE